MNIEKVENKLQEASFFLMKMQDHERDESQDTASFAYYLSAFLSAAMSVRTGFHVKQDRKRNDAVKAWHAQWEASLPPQGEVIYRFMHKDRVAEVHGSGSSRDVKMEERELFHGTYRLPSGTFEVIGPPGVRPLGFMRIPRYSFTIDGAERKATEVCSEYLTLLARMVEDFRAAHP
jgi:hypothetical protein